MFFIDHIYDKRSVTTCLCRALFFSSFPQPPSVSVLLNVYVTLQCSNCEIRDHRTKFGITSRESHITDYNSLTVVRTTYQFSNKPFIES